MKHLAYLKMANFAFAGMLLLGAVFLLLGMGLQMIVGLMDGEIAAVIAPAIVGVVALLVMGAFAAAYVMVGRNVSEARWRIPQTVLAVLALGSFPLGTAYGAYALWLLWLNDDTKRLFETA